MATLRFRRIAPALARDGRQHLRALPLHSRHEPTCIAMIQSAPSFIAVLLLVAGILHVLERGTGWRGFRVLPPIVLIYLVVTALAVLGAWQATPEIRGAQQFATGRLLPALLFLLLAACDLRAVLALGPRMLGAFAYAVASILLAFVIVFVLFGARLGADAAGSFAALSGSWTGGTANLLAVKQAIGLPERALSPVLLTDAICYSVWVLVLFSAAPLAAGFNRWNGARDVAAQSRPAQIATPVPAEAGSVLLWLGIGLAVGALAAHVAASLPASGAFGATTWTLLIVTAAGLIAAHTPLARLPGSTALASALLSVVVAAMASQSSFDDLGSAPGFVLAGFMVLAVHAMLMLMAARLFKLDLFTCSVCSLASIGGPASAPLLAAMYARPLVPIGVLLALLGYVIGTPLGIGLAALLQAIEGG
jgi:uncharacterized membrane protein